MTETKGVEACNLKRHGAYRFWTSGSKQITLAYVLSGGPSNNLIHITTQTTRNVVAIALIGPAIQLEHMRFAPMTTHKYVAIVIVMIACASVKSKKQK